MDDHSAIAHDATMHHTADACWRREARTVPYDEAMGVMRGTVAAIRDERAFEQVWLLQHPPIFTAGTSARQEDLFNPHGFQTFSAGRGGQWTYHGPGQRIAYVMLDLQRRHGTVPDRDVRAFVTALEGWLIASLAQLGIEAGRRDGRVGVWVRDSRTGRDNKIAALGVRITRWVSWHGVSINLSPDLGHFGGIVPCGIREHGVTSVAALGRVADMALLDDALAACWPDFFGGDRPSIREA